MNDLNDESKMDKKKSPSKEEEKLSVEEQLKNSEDKLLRSLAEIENQRNRFEKEIKEAIDFGSFNFARESLAILDNLRRAHNSIKDDETLKNTPGIKKLIDHIDIINNDMISIFKKNNIEPIKAIGQKLDPNIHQAMMEVEDDEKEQGTIVQEIQAGYMFRDRLLRPSLVAVSKKNDNKSSKNDDKNEKNE